MLERLDITNIEPRSLRKRRMTSSADSDPPDVDTSLSDESPVVASKRKKPTARRSTRTRFERYSVTLNTDDSDNGSSSTSTSTPNSTAL